MRSLLSGSLHFFLLVVLNIFKIRILSQADFREEKCMELGDNTLDGNMQILLLKGLIHRTKLQIQGQTINASY